MHDVSHESAWNIFLFFPRPSIFFQKIISRCEKARASILNMGHQEENHEQKAGPTSRPAKQGGEAWPDASREVGS